MLARERAKYSGGNSLFDLLLAEEPGAVESAAVERFESGNVLLDSNQPITHVYFPIDMMISTTTLMRDATEVEVGSIGCEGMAGVQLLLGVDHVPGKVLCQVPGSALRWPAQAFLECVERSPAALKLMQRYLQAVMNFLEIQIACNALHDAPARCARWLLVTQDRVQRDDFRLTQEFLAMMLGVRRATVNSIAQGLQHDGTIRYARGHVQIVDHAALELASCECYRLSIDRYNDLLGQRPYRSRSASSRGA